MAAKRAFLALMTAAVATCVSAADSRRVTPHETMLQRITAAAAMAPKNISVTTAGVSVQGRVLPHVTIRNGGGAKPWKLVFIGTQHGDEPAGREALIDMIEAYAKAPGTLPKDTELHILPSANPDGTAANKRRNANDADLNRDHILLLQPETQAVHRVVREVQPSVVVDCHEFRRDTGDYTKQGWLEWPLIMMDSVNSPFVDDALVAAAWRWVEAARPAMEKAGFNYTRYFVGDAPPGGEQRFSTVECDDARNGLGLSGALSFIIESGVYRGRGNPDADLHERVAAYDLLLKRFINEKRTRASDLMAVQRARSGPAPKFLPTNAFWGRNIDAPAETQITTVKVVDAKTSAVEEIDAPRFMPHRIVKNYVPAPEAYVIETTQTELFRGWLERHGVAFEVLASTRSLTVEESTLVRVEAEEDPVYERYGNRQIVSRGEAKTREFGAGALLAKRVPPQHARVAALLEPAQLYGVFAVPPFNATVGEKGRLPVYRVMGKAD